jgi:hypothetical protein
MSWWHAVPPNRSQTIRAASLALTETPVSAQNCPSPMKASKASDLERLAARDR